MVQLWTKWARQYEVAFPKRFNMYDFLQNKKKYQSGKKNNLLVNKSGVVSETIIIIFVIKHNGEGRVG